MSNTAPMNANDAREVSSVKPFEMSSEGDAVAAAAAATRAPRRRRSPTGIRCGGFVDGFGFVDDGFVEHDAASPRRRSAEDARDVATTAGGIEIERYRCVVARRIARAPVAL